MLPKKVKIDTQKKLNIKSPKENGKTFLENSLIKANIFQKKLKKICLSDDSGLKLISLIKATWHIFSKMGRKKIQF